MSGEWTPVEAEMPPRFEPVLVCYRNKHGVANVAEGYLVEDGATWKVYGAYTKTVSHWMPKPSLPWGVPVCKCP